MINIKKSENPPKCLSEEKKKANGDYKCGTVLVRLKEDFHNKCYLCEEKEPSTINVEHLIPHRGDKDLEFDWDNLFWAYGHCNNLKSDKYDNIINCTNTSIIVTDILKFEINPFPYDEAKIFALSEETSVTETATLLNEIYNGTTILKTLEGENIRKKLINEIKLFNENLHEYFEPALTNEEKERLKNKIKRSLSVEAPFTAFKIWVIKNNTKLYELFGELLPDFKSN